MHKNKSSTSKKDIIEYILTMLVIIVLAFGLIVIPFTLWYADTHNGRTTVRSVFKIYMIWK